MTPMYLEHFGLLESPFSIAPDPRYLYMSERHREALAHLLYGMQSDGAFILLTGDVGTGKTTVSRCLLEQVPEHINIALVLNPKLTAVELLQVISDELCIEYAAAENSVKSLVDGINHYLLAAHAQGKKTVVLIEEAQNLDLDVLEQLRLLTNLETNERKLLQVILLGQPEFLDVLDRPELSQLAQRITARFHLTPLNINELQEYINHRLAVAGCRRPLFAFGVLKSLYQYSGGVPRLINVICDRALLGVYVQGRHQIDKKTLSQSAKEVLGENKTALVKNRNKVTGIKFLAVAVVSLVVTSLVYFADEIKQYVKHNAVVDVLPAITEDENIPPASEAIAQPVVEKLNIEWPDNNQRLRSNTEAYRELFKAWKLDYKLGEVSTPCFYAQKQGLSCLQGSADIDDLRKLNRPAVLKFYDDFKEPNYVALLELGESTAIISLGDKLQTISLEQLAFYWQGEFSLLWRMPPEYEDSIRPWTTGKTVLWLSETMNQIDGDVKTMATNRYDTPLLNRVKQFQTLQGLSSDGVVGARTLIRINQVLGLNAPVLEPVN